ncbi:MAG: hypothetical protein L3J09_00475 [Flavobacteriaceae bacterium]|nr:hypothetical protein [Flavobacteriaceae bacterium]
MKTLLSILFISTFLLSPSLTKVRKDYVVAVSNKEQAIKLNKELIKVNKTDSKVLVAYKGAVLTLMARFAKGIKEKKEFFKEGTALIEYAVLENPDNIEIRVVRLGVQENSPKVVGYRKNKEEDKQFIIDHYNEVSSKELKDYIKGFVLQSKSFSEEEKSFFK